jgi:hypothetical protein
VGAGDTFMANLLAELDLVDALGNDPIARLAKLSDSDLQRAAEIAAVAAGIAGSVAYSYMKDGVVDPNKGPVMTGEFGTVQMNPNDKAMYGADGKIKVGTNLLGDDNGKITSIKSTPVMDITPMIAAMNQTTAAINELKNKSWDVKLDSKSVGAGLIQNSYRSA